MSVHNKRLTLQHKKRVKRGDDSSLLSLRSHAELHDAVQNEPLRVATAGDGAGRDSGNVSTAEAESDNDEPVDVDQENIDAYQKVFEKRNTDFQMVELYEEIIYEILHTVGSDASKTNPEAMFTFMQHAFKLPHDMHNEILADVKQRKAPKLRLNIHVIEARSLEPMDPNGMADPFVTLYFASAHNRRYTSTIKTETLNPYFDEEFSIPISNNPNSETLVIKVWDFDAAESMGQKVQNMRKIKGFRGFRKLLMEVKAKAFSERHDEEYMGGVKIPISHIPAIGMLDWFNLFKKGEKKSQGQIRLHISFNSKKNLQFATREHRQLLDILLHHELAESQVPQQFWTQKFSLTSETIIAQHIGQSPMNGIDGAFAQWTVFANVHQTQPISLQLFHEILDVLIEPVKLKRVNDSEDLKRFWEATKFILPSCFNTVMNLHDGLNDDSLNQLMNALSIIAKIVALEPPKPMDLFPEQFYDWLQDNREMMLGIRDAVSQAVVVGSMKYFDNIIDLEGLSSEYDDVRLQDLTKVVQVVRTDLLLAIKRYDKIFKEIINLHYAEVIYKVFDEKLAELVQPIVEDICVNKIEMPNLQSVVEMDSLDQERFDVVDQLLKTLFELFLLLQSFSMDYGSNVCSDGAESRIKNYAEWFKEGIGYWIDVSVYKAKTRIRRAVYLDSLTVLDATVNYSSSAVDTMSIFYQISKFWEQLGLPDTDESYKHFSKIVNDICNCCELYADQMAMRADELGAVQTAYKKKFKVTREWCVAMNSIDYIRQKIPQFMEELGVEDENEQELIEENTSYISEALSDEQEFDHDWSPLHDEVTSTIDEMENKIRELCVSLTGKLILMRKYLFDAAESFEDDPYAMDRLMTLMDAILNLLHSELNADNFDRILDAIWCELSHLLQILIENSVKQQRLPRFYDNLRNMLTTMIEHFKSPNEGEPDYQKTLNDINATLELHSKESAELIHLYYKECYKLQQEAPKAPHGILTVRCFFTQKALEVQIINGKHLIVMDSNNSSDPFVSFNFYPEIDSVDVTQLQTKVHQETLFPMFDEKFTIPLTEDQRNKSENLIIFSMIDMDCMGLANQFMGDALLMFKDIPDTSKGEAAGTLVNLTLSRPVNDDKDERIRILQSRTDDDMASKFIGDFRQKTQIKKLSYRRGNRNVFADLFRDFVRSICIR